MIKLAKLNGKPEIFHSIQGEGKSLGQPSIFIRLSLCNLYCVWCDTDYTWNWENTNFRHNNDSNRSYKKFSKKEMIISLSASDIMDIISGINCKNLVITGGEPMVQHKELLSFFQLVKSQNNRAGYKIEFETNGTIIPSPELDELTDQYNVSVKLVNSGIPESVRIKPEAIRFYSSNNKSNFKFVVDDLNDLGEIQDLARQFHIDDDKIYLMPQGITQTELKKKQGWLVELCKERNFNYTDRMHIHIFGNKRGV